MYGDYNADQDFDGLDDILQKIPRLTLAQSNTEELKDDSDVYLPGLKRGHYFTTKGRSVIGPTARIRIFQWREVWIEWSGTEYVASHRPRSINIVNESEYGKWETESGNKISPTIEFLVQAVSLENEGLLVMSFKGKSYKAGKNILRIVSSVREDGQLLPIWATEIEVVSSKQSNESGDFYVIGDGSAKSGGKLIRDEKGNIKKLPETGPNSYETLVKPVIALAQSFKNALPAPEEARQVNAEDIDV